MLAFASSPSQPAGLTAHTRTRAVAACPNAITDMPAGCVEVLTQCLTAVSAHWLLTQTHSNSNMLPLSFPQLAETIGGSISSPQVANSFPRRAGLGPIDCGGAFRQGPRPY